MRIIFMGTPEFAVPALEELHKAGHEKASHEIVCVYSQPPRPGGRRGRELTPSPVQRKAEELGIPVRHPVSLKGAEEQAEFAALKADIAVVAAYGLILPKPILAAPKHGCLNIHASLLPRWRGAAPIQRAILAGDEKTGVCIMRMEAGLDTGPVLAREKTEIGFYDTAGALTHRLAHMGAQLVVKVLEDLPRYTEVPQPEEGVTYARKIEKSEAKLDFTKGALQVHRQIRAFNPTPGAWFEVNGERIKVLEASILSESPQNLSMDFPAEPGVVIGDQLAIGCGNGAIRPTWLVEETEEVVPWLEPIKVQRAGRPAMPTSDLLRGFPIPVGTKLD